MSSSASWDKRLQRFQPAEVTIPRWALETWHLSMAVDWDVGPVIAPLIQMGYGSQAKPSLNVG